MNEDLTLKEIKVLAKRVLERTKKAPSGCLIYKQRPLEYAKISAKNRPRPAHRVTYEAHFGKRIPSNMLACHKCDTPGCVNPKHIFVGTHQDNSRDCVKKGRHAMQKDPSRMAEVRKLAIGPKHHSAKLTWEDVDDIRKRYAAGETKLAISKVHGVAPKAVYRIVYGKGWDKKVTESPIKRLLPKHVQYRNGNYKVVIVRAGVYHYVSGLKTLAEAQRAVEETLRRLADVVE